MTEINITEEDWKIIEDRLDTMPEELQLGILEQSFTKRELIEQVKRRTEIGEAYAKMQLEFIKWLAKQSKIV